MDTEVEFITLYSYLGYTIGPGLYKEVYDKAVSLNEPIKVKESNGGRYKRKVRKYRKEFLKDYFNDV